METMTVERVRERMTQCGVSRHQLARETHIARPNIVAMLNGKQYAGPTRLGRMAAAIERLEHARTIEATDKDGKVVFRLSQL